MNRRTLLASLAVLPLARAAFAKGAGFVDYEPGVITEALAAGKTVFVDYATDWCSTCAAQERVIAKHRAENPAYDENLLFVRVDFDEFGGHEVSTSRNIPRRSTLIVLHGEEELGRLVANANPGKIQALLDAGLAAATGAS